jgi:[acyl-carrier-protein] S-malonyltransferase
MKLACVFPGQGSQAVGMLGDFLSIPPVSALVQSADASLTAAGADGKLSDLIANGPAEDLALTVNTQPAMLLAAVGAYYAWREAGGPAADMVAGHSLGEYSALVAAGALSADDAFPLTRLRAQAMQSAVPVGEGGMAAVLGLDDAAVEAVCTEASKASGEQVAPANFNAPSQVVIAGHSGAVDAACKLAKEAGAKRALPLSVSAPFHSVLLKPAGDALQTALKDIKLQGPEVPLINNVDVAIESEPDKIRDALVRQAYSPVRWVEVVQKIKSMGATHMIEFGPGKVLTGLAGRIDKSIKAACVHDAASMDKALTMLNESA